MVARAGRPLLVRQSRRQRRCASQETSRGTSSYVTPGAVQHLNFSLVAAHYTCGVPLCRDGRTVRCYQLQSLPAVRICICTSFAFAGVLYIFSVQCTIHDTHSASASIADHAKAYLDTANGSLVTRTAVSLTVAKIKTLLCA
jgi:hypothetical protein